MSKVRTRFAPSPTGFLHLGGLRTALYAYLFARHHGGDFILRIEDTDQEREVPGAVDKIYRAMELAGLHYDEGPDVGGPCGPYVQTQRRDLYLPYAQELVRRGGAYYCFCTKERLDEARAQCEGRGETYKYDKRCLHLSDEEVRRRIAAGEPWVIRQNVPETGTASFDDLIYGHVEVDCATLDDNVLIKADGLPTYNFANVVDDHLMGITHVLRGTEYLSSSPKYNLLYQGLGWEPPVYVHLPVVMANQHRKLSKRHGDPSFEDLLDQGYVREAIVNYIALLGWSPGTDQEFWSLAELEQAFDISGISKSPSIFDMDKLTWFNAEYIRRLPFAAYYELAEPWLKPVLPPDIDLRKLAALLQARTEVFNRLPEMVDFLAETLPFGEELYAHKKMKTDGEVARRVLPIALETLRALPEWTDEALHEALLGAAAANGLKNGQMLWPVRVALSGKPSTPGGAIEIASLLGRERTLARLEAAIAALQG